MRRATGRRVRGRRRGFTLVELLVVLVIVGMVAAVVVPALRSRGGAAAAAKELATLYETARELAIVRGAPVVAVVDLSSGTYHLLDERLGRPPDTLRRGSLALPADARLASRAARGAGAARMSFDALGRARGDDVVIADADARHEVLTDPWTGASRVQAAP